MKVLLNFTTFLRFFTLICVMGLSLACAAKRVGPVSEYGQLQVGKNAEGKGQIYGSCKAYSTSGNEVQVKGMSLFWSINPQSAKFWDARIISGIVEKHGVQLVRAAMGVDEDWGVSGWPKNGALMTTLFLTSIMNRFV